jgi:hypothetical protein
VTGSLGVLNKGGCCSDASFAACALCSQNIQHLLECRCMDAAEL